MQCMEPRAEHPHWNNGVEVNLSRFLSFVYICISFGDPIIRGNPINHFSPPRFLCVQWVEVRDD